MESLAGALGIAALAPTAAAGRFVRRVGDPLRGYALINGEDGRIALSVWLENGRPLNDRTGRDGFYYEAWLGDLSMGPFNVDNTGHGALTTRLDLGTEPSAWPTGAPPALVALQRAFVAGLPATLPVRVTVEPFGGTPSGGIPVLAGSLIWLGSSSPLGEGDPVDEALSLSGAPSLGPEVSAAAPSLSEPWVKEPETVSTPEADAAVAAAEAGATEPPLTEQPTGSAFDGVQWPEAAAVGPDVEQEATTPEEAEATAEPEAEVPGPTSEETAAPEIAEPEAVSESAEAAPEVAPTPDPTPVAIEQEAPEQPPSSTEQEAQLAAHLDQNLTVTRRPLIRPAAPEAPTLSPTFRIKSAHPLAPRVHASGTLDAQGGGLKIQIRSLPSPTALGKDEATGRPWSAYRVWLTHSRTGATMAVGLLARGLVDQWRLEVPEGLPLQRFDTLLVCLDDRSTPSSRPEPIVLQGSLLAAH